MVLDCIAVKPVGTVLLPRCSNLQISNRRSDNRDSVSANHREFFRLLNLGLIVPWNGKSRKVISDLLHALCS